LRSVILLALVVGYFAHHLWVLHRLEPSTDTQTLAAFAERMPPPSRLALADAEGGRYVVWIGDWPQAFVSGPPCYVFDSSGRLVDWSVDTGDDHHLIYFCHLAGYNREISLDDALAFTAVKP